MTSNDSESVAPGCLSPSATNRRELLAAAAALLAAAGASSPSQAAEGAEGYFLAFETHNRLFFIPSAWLELFEVTGAYGALYPTDPDALTNAIKKVRNSNPQGRKYKFDVLYADLTDPEVLPFPDRTPIPALPPGGDRTYTAAMISPSPT